MRLNILLLLSTILLSACAIPKAAPYDAPDTLDLSMPYIITPGDSLKIVVYGEEGLGGTYTVDTAGDIVLPMVGSLPVGSLNEEQAQKKIAQAFIAGEYLTDPLVSVNVAAYRALAVLGAVKTPGTYPYAPATDVLKLVAQAGGYTPRAAEGRVLIDRHMPDGSLQRLNGGAHTPLLPGDTITVREQVF